MSTQPRLAFLTVGTRGCATSVQDYAHYSEEFLGLARPTLIVAAPPSGVGDKLFRTSVAELDRRFNAANVHRLPRWPPDLEQVDAICRQTNVTHLYIAKAGPRDGVLSRLPHVRNLVHAIFDATQPHGDVYARVSPSVAGRVPVVPHIVRRASAAGPDLRQELRIPAGATVFGRHGGMTTFDIKFVHRAVLAAVAARDDVWFLFLNTQPFWKEAGELGEEQGADAVRRRAAYRRVLFLPPTSDEARKSAFIRTCDAMLHARSRGETFGLAVAEFAQHNRPVLTSNVSHNHHRDRHHLDALGAKGMYYHDEASLLALLHSFNRTDAARRDWRAYSEYAPQPVMRRFAATFLPELRLEQPMEQPRGSVLWAAEKVERTHDTHSAIG
jgi:hypothetical protein